jgi:hypothetical protein
MNKISEKKVKELIKELKGMSSLKDGKRKINYWYNQKNNVVNSDNISTDLIKEFLDVYNQLKKKQPKTESVETDDRAEINQERDEDGKIQFYTFAIYRKNTPTLEGKLDRKEMETIYRLYTIYGANLTQKIVSREFPQYTFVEFKRILRAFNIYKANSEFAPHIIEEKSEEELITLHNQNKENNVLRRIEKDQLAEANKLINKLAQENQKLSKSSKLFEDLLKYDPNYKNEKYFSLNNLVDEKESAIIFLSDLHIGAYNEKFGFYQLPNYDRAEIMRRLDVILDKFINKQYKHLIVVDLGDSIDQFNKETTRGGHLLPNNMTDKEMSHLYLDCMNYFFTNLKSSVNADNYCYYSIGESNHSGDFGWALNLALSYKLQQLGWHTYVSDYPIDDFKVGNYRFIYTHGKDNNNQYKQFPLTLNPQTELYFANYIAEKKLNSDGEKIYVVKGDLHQYAYTSGKQFDYISVGSMYATSNYIAANWGNTPWSINYAILNSNNIMFGKVSDDN